MNKVQAFVSSWNGCEDNVKDTVSLLSAYCPTKHLEETHHQPFAVQWEDAVNKFFTPEYSADIFLWVAGDVRVPSDLHRLFFNMNYTLGSGLVAIYAPDVYWTSQIYNREKIPLFMPNAYEVCGTDLLMCAITRGLLQVAAPITGNTRGWYYDYALTAYAHVIGKKVVRDYSVTAGHPRGSAYDMTGAIEASEKWRKSLPLDIQGRIIDLIKEQERVSW
jgi:hypothetical protein